ncbi:Hypothetical protein NTJ_04940 [Nesidiocoris tenuis]|nr:Hypothetical protein NTJ_04940 [Nesidiocoris tenuis]
MKLLLLFALAAFVAGAEIKKDRPSPQPVNPSVCVNKLGDKPDSNCACKVFIRGNTPEPSYYLKWNCPNANPNKPQPTAAFAGPAPTPPTKSATTPGASLLKSGVGASTPKSVAFTVKV